MEAQLDIQTYMDRGKQALALGQGREAAIAYAHAAQIEPNDPRVHLGLAEANLALGNYDVVRMACRRVQELQPDSGVEAMTAQALLDLLDRRYERALQNVNSVIEQDPTIGYVHALRAYLLRATHQDYDANLARARAGRLSYGAHYDNIFPSLEPDYRSGYGATAISSYTPEGTESNGFAPDGDADTGTDAGRPDAPRVEREQVPTWSRPNAMQRQMVRTRFALSQHPGLVTNILIAINVIIYLLSAIFPDILNVGAQYNPLVSQGQIWLIFTAMFLHASPLHVGLNMLSLFFIGRPVEMIYGKWRYLVIYLLSGIAGGLAYYLLNLTSTIPSVGASGAIFGVFGALGIFYITNRRALGPVGSGAIVNWLFWLGLNLVFGLSSPGINIEDHIFGLIAGMIIGYILLPRLRISRRI